MQKRVSQSEEVVWSQTVIFTSEPDTVSTAFHNTNAFFHVLTGTQPCISVSIHCGGQECWYILDKSTFLPKVFKLTLQLYEISYKEYSHKPHK